MMLSEFIVDNLTFVDVRHAAAPVAPSVGFLSVAVVRAVGVEVPVTVLSTIVVFCAVVITGMGHPVNGESQLYFYV